MGKKKKAPQLRAVDTCATCRQKVFTASGGIICSKYDDQIDMLTVCDAWENRGHERGK